MKILGCIIQNRNIKENTDSKFFAEYKGKQIIISSYHNLGKPKLEHLTRFNIDVIDIKTGINDVDTYEDCHDIRDAIRYAIAGVGYGLIIKK